MSNIMSYFSQLGAITLISLFSSIAHSESFFFDSFETGDLSATSVDGFKWADSNRTSVVTSEDISPSIFGNSTTGEHSLRFRYAANTAWSEQRFSIGNSYPELWMSFWLRVPTNFSHPATEEACCNQKLFFLWMDEYEAKGEGSSVGMEFRPDGLGGSYFYSKISPGGYTGTGYDIGKAPFIEIPADRGRWMHLIVHVQSESALGAENGLMEVWRKWEGQSEYTKTQDLKDQPIRLSSTVKGFSNGYLMGWANGAYPVDTEFLIDDFKLSVEPLLNSMKAPSPPTGFFVE
jgi:hypothetical protein